jgi:hypothetical protein
MYFRHNQQELLFSPDMLAMQCDIKYLVELGHNIFNSKIKCKKDMWLPRDCAADAEAKN